MALGGHRLARAAAIRSLAFAAVWTCGLLALRRASSSPGLHRVFMTALAFRMSSAECGHMRVQTHVLEERQAHACAHARVCTCVCVRALGMFEHAPARDSATHTILWLLQQVANTLALERPVLAADDEDEDEGDDSQIIDLDGINGKKLAVSVLFRTRNLLPSNPRLLLLCCPLCTGWHGWAKTELVHRQNLSSIS